MVTFDGTAMPARTWKLIELALTCGTLLACKTDCCSVVRCCAVTFWPLWVWVSALAVDWLWVGPCVLVWPWAAFWFALEFEFRSCAVWPDPLCWLLDLLSALASA